ncbi:MAG TPA: pilus assembly protein TadG-related protein [Myxococcus sp.]|nr:pilus assembly protein TadG-related protein [Myxococcus sp.]
MFTRTLRQSFRRQEGQALVLAALMVLVMSIAVLTTVNIGQHVHERIRLQNTADAAAYSMAAMEARAFNFYAYANRTQVSHYVSAMMWQSLLSLIYSAEAFFTDLYGFMKTLNPCAGDQEGLFWPVACLALENLVPYVSQVLRAIGRIIDMYKSPFLTGIQRALRLADPDNKIGRYLIPAHRVLNGVLYFAAKTVMVSAHTHIGQTTQSVIDANDSNLTAGNTRSLFGQLATGLYSACLFDQAHMDESGGGLRNIARNPFEPINPRARANADREARAKRAMGAISNATRYACDSEGGICPERFVTSRELGDLIPLPDFLGFIRDLLNEGVDSPIFRFKKMGQTRMLTFGYPGKRAATRDSRNYIRDWNDSGTQNAWGMLGQGDNIGADDIYWFSFGPARFPGLDNPFSCDKDDNPRQCWGDNRYIRDTTREKIPYRYTMKPSIWAMNKEEDTFRDGGVHWRVNYDRNFGGWRGWTRPSGPEREVGVHREEVCVLGPKIACIVEIDVYTANVLPVEDGNHPWAGIVPFMHFEPGQYGSTCNPASTPQNTLASREVDFNQPTTWVALNKTPAQVVNKENKDNAGSNAPALLNEEGKVSFKFNDETDELEMQNDRKKFAMFLEGLNVISRGQSYYHRPGNWTEQPNFFNPYWRPRLASVYQGRHNLPALGPLMDGLPGPMQGIFPKIMTH